MDETVVRSVERPLAAGSVTNAAVYVAGPAVLAQGICRIMADAPNIPGKGIEASPLPSPEEWASSGTSPLPLLALSTALLLISFGNVELLQNCLTAIVDLPVNITPPHIALMTSGLDSNEISVAVEQGIQVFISTNETLGSVYSGVMAALAGLPFCSLLLEPLVTAARYIPSPQTVPVLTAREWEVAKRIVQGHSDAEAAACLFISVATLKTHLRSVYHKLGIKRRGQLSSALSQIESRIT